MNILNCSTSVGEFGRIKTANTTSILLRGDGSYCNPLRATLIVSPDSGNILEIRDNGVYVACCGDGGEGGEVSGTVVVGDTITLDLSGNGAASTPIFGNVNVADIPNNAIQILPTGLYVPSVIEAGLVYGGIVTWLGDYDYHVSAAGYYINGQFYESPAADFTLSPPDLSDNRLDTFIVDITGVSSVLEGTPSSNPVQAPLDPATQLELSIALVEVGTTEPTIPHECAYRENTEWTSLSSNLARINPDSTTTPCNGLKSIEATAAVHSNNILLTRASSFQPLSVHSQLTFELKSKAVFNANYIVLQWELAGAPVGTPVNVLDGTYDFDSSNTLDCHLVAIPLHAFTLTSASTVDSLRITTNVTSGTLGFFIDDICLQGQPVPPIPTPLDERVKVSGDDTTAGYLEDKLVAGAGISLTVNNPGANETLTIASTSVLTFDNGLTRTLDNVQLGGTLLHDTTIDNQSFTFFMIGNDSAPLFQLTQSGSGGGAYFQSNSGTAVTGVGTTGGLFNGTVFGVVGNTNSDIATPGSFSGNYTTVDDVKTIVQVTRSTSGVADTGIGGAITFDLETNANFQYTVGDLIYKLTNASDGSQTSQFEVNAMDTGVLGRKFAIAGNGQAILDEYGVGTFIDTAAYILGVDADGNVVETALGGALSITADNGLSTSSSTNVQLGGTLLQNTIIDTTAAYNLTITGALPFASNNGTLSVFNTDFAGVGIYAEGAVTALYGIATDSFGYGVVGDGPYTGVSGTSDNFGVYGSGDVISVYAEATDPTIAIIYSAIDSATLVSTPTNIKLYRQATTNTSATSGMGQSIDFTTALDSTNPVTHLEGVTNRIISKITGTGVYNNYSSEFALTGVSGAVEAQLFTLSGTGAVRFDSYGGGSFTGTPTYILATDISGNIIETSTSSLLAITADNGLTANTSTNVRLGGTLMQNTTVNTAGFTTTWTGANPSGYGFLVVNSGVNGNALYGQSTSGLGVFGTSSTSAGVSGQSGTNTGVSGTSSTGSGVFGFSTSGQGGSFSSTNSYAVSAISSSTTAMLATTSSTGTNDVLNVLSLRRQTTGVAAAGLGGAISFELERSDGSVQTQVGRLLYKWSNPTPGILETDFELYANNGSSERKLAILGATGQLILDDYGTGAISGTAAYVLGVDASGNVIEVAAAGAGMSNPMTTTGDIIYSSSGTGTPARLGIGTNGDILTVSGGVPVWQTPGVGGTVTTVSVVTANGFSGSVASPAATPAITIATTQTGLLQGDGTAISGITNSSTVGQVLRVTGASTYAWGALDLADSDAITGDLPFSSLTQGSARSVLGVAGNATADVASIQGTANQVLRVDSAGTGLAFGQLNLASSAAVTGILDEVNGGTGQSTFTTGDILYSSGSNTLAKLGIGSTNQVLTVIGGVPTWQTPTTGTVTSVSGTTNRISSTGGATPVIDIHTSYVGQASITTLGTVTTGTWNGTVIGPVYGGTGQTTWSTGQLMYASAANTLAKLTIGTVGQVLRVSAGGIPEWASVAGSGTVTSINASGGTTGLTFSGGPITTTGTLTLAGTLGAVNGGTGLTSYAQGDLIYASAANTLSKLAKDTNATRYLSNTGTNNNPAWAQINLANGVTGDLPFANLTQGAARSVLGVSGNGTADVASIQGTTDQVLRITSAGTGLGFGAINLAATATVGSSILNVANGGTGQSTYTNGQLLIGNTTGNTLTKATLTAGSGITITNGPGSVTISGQFNNTRQVLTDATTITWDANAGESAVVIINNINRTLSITNPVAGRTYVIEVVQGLGGNRTISTWPSGTLWNGGTTPTLATAANKIDLFTFHYTGSNYLGTHVGTFN